ncbi:MAG: hypothetical protein COV46_01295 [Deltaproteobacteria bacterium CG11_big_fil_rev_8_21_14_0_20_49_13]|nr:MAG: hypothetical protein COV46_01295 [Deltaproteobacteria bacterium CG11_big_fil_rev_8_21_14_0_20_49_13]
MFKTILICILIYYVFRWIRRMIVCEIYKRKASATPQKEIVSELVKCDKCSVYVSKNTAIYKDGKWTCADGCSSTSH